MSSLAPRVPRIMALSGGAVLGLPAMAAGANHALAPLSARRVQPVVTYYEPAPGAHPDVVVVGAHGLWSSTWITDQVDQFRRWGAVLAVRNGADVERTPQLLFNELEAANLLDRIIITVGFSMGTLTIVDFLRLYKARTGRDVPYGLMVCGPAAPEYVLWPQTWLPWLLGWLEGGPVMQLIWRHGLAAKIARDVAVGARVHAGSVISGVRKLSRGPSLVAGEFAGTMLYFAEHQRDHRVLPCFPQWQTAAPRSVLEILPGEGHGDWQAYPEVYEQLYRNAWDYWGLGSGSLAA